MTLELMEAAAQKSREEITLEFSNFRNHPLASLSRCQYVPQYKAVMPRDMRRKNTPNSKTEVPSTPTMCNIQIERVEVFL